jgi:hypothetical protein
MKSKFQDKSLTYCLFQEGWWLDAVAPGAWADVIVEQDGRIIGKMPYVMVRRGGRRYLMQPPLTKFLGPWIAPYTGKQANLLSYQKQIVEALLTNLPKFDEARFELHYEIDNWQPFYWKGFSQTSYYSYVIDDLTDLDAVFSEFRSEKRKDISKAIKQLVVFDDFSPIDLFKHHKASLAKQGKSISYNSAMLERIYVAAVANDGGRILCARDMAGKVHAAIFIVWDSRSAFFLISSIDPELRSSGATTLLIWEAIKYCATRTKRFDFEGSMIEPVANSFRAFGAVPKSYSILSRTDSKLLRFRNGINAFLQRS